MWTSTADNDPERGFSAMGFYPVDPVSGNYVFGAPQLPKITLHLADGKTFTVIAEGISAENKYVESIAQRCTLYSELHHPRRHPEGRYLGVQDEEVNHIRTFIKEIGLI